MIKILFSVIFTIFLCGNSSALNSEFEEKLNSLKWVAYSPTNFNPRANLYPSTRSLEEDLKVLFNAGFNGIVTYGSDNTLGEIPKIAKELGFKGVIMGIWDINSPRELSNAFKMSTYVDGYCVGNEGLDRRYQLEELKTAISYVKEKTGKPSATTEEVGDYVKQYILELGDWVFPNVHPFLANVNSPYKAVRWINNHNKIIRRHAAPGSKPVLLKEIGYPTKGNRYASQKNQKEFFLMMEKSNVKFVYFEAFDQYWKKDLRVEPYWGLFDKKRRPKKFILEKIKQTKKK